MSLSHPTRGTFTDPPDPRWPFNATLFIAGVFGLAAGGSQNLVTLASLVAVLGIGVGGAQRFIRVAFNPELTASLSEIGNLPVDSAIFLGEQVRMALLSGLTTTSLDFMPASHQYLLAVVAAFWSFGQFFISLVMTTLFFPSPFHSSSNRRSLGP